MADFGLTKGKLDSFKRIGLGIYVLVNQAECGKVLCFLPNQYMPEHRHQSVIFTNPNIERITHIEEHPT